MGSRVPLSAPEPLADHHQLAVFDSGIPALNDWLKRRGSARYRERLQQDEAIVPVRVNVGDIAVALVGCGVLAPGDVDDRRKLAQALNAQIRDWAAGWR